MSSGESSQQPARPGLLAALAIVLVAAPALAGYLLLRDDGSPESDMADGGMGTTATTVGPGSRDLVELISAGSAQVRDFTEILASDIAVTISPAGDTAEIRLQTNIEVACAVAFGRTPAFGSLATDTDMAGGGHTDHHPLLRGLDPGSEYLYRIHAIGPDGSLYVSETMALTATETGTGDVDAVSAPGPNLTAIASVDDVSSEYSDAFAAPNAIDGDGLTEWSSAGDGDDAYISLDFGEEIHAIGVGFRTREMTDGTSITTSFTVTVDGNRIYGPFEAGPGLAIAEIEFIGRVVRIDVATSTGGNTGAVEVEVYGQTVADEAGGM